MKVTPVQLRSVILRETRRALREAYGDISPSREEQERVNPPSPSTGGFDIMDDGEITETIAQLAHMIAQKAIDSGLCDDESEDVLMLEEDAYETLSGAVSKVWNDAGLYASSAPRR